MLIIITAKGLHGYILLTGDANDSSVIYVCQFCLMFSHLQHLLKFAQPNQRLKHIERIGKF
jgi:hypothetical protein